MDVNGHDRSMFRAFRMRMSRAGNDGGDHTGRGYDIDSVGKFVLPVKRPLEKR